MFTILVALLPILEQFKAPVPLISLGEILLLPYVFAYLFKDAKSLVVEPLLAVFYFVPLVTTTVVMIFSTSYINLMDSFSVIARIFFYYLFIIVAIKEVEYPKFIKCYCFLAILLTLYLICQVLVHYLIGVELPVLMNNASVLFHFDESMTSERYYFLYGFRPPSLFTEPSYYAVYVAPFLAILLFSRDTERILGLSRIKTLILAVVISGTCLLSTSSSGVLFLVIIWGYFFFISANRGGLSVFGKIILTLLILVAVFIVLTSPLFGFVVSRTISGATFGQRIGRGFLIFDQMDSFRQIFGVGLNNLGNYVLSQGITTPFDEEDLNYAVSFTSRLVTTGIIGLTAVVVFFTGTKAKCKGPLSTLMLALTAVTFFVMSGEYTNNFAFMFLILTFCINEERRHASLCSARITTGISREA